MSTEETERIERNKDLVRQLGKAHMRSDRHLASELLSPKLVWRMAGQAKVMNRDEYLEGIDMGARAFSDIHQQIHQMIAEDDRVAAYCSWRMKHTGQFVDIAPTKRTVEFTSLWLYRIVDGRIVEIWAFDEDFTPQLK